MLLNDDIERMFKKAGASLKLGYEKTSSRTKDDVHNFFYKDKSGKPKFLARFTAFTDRGLINIVMSLGSRGARVKSFGPYDEEELMDKAKREIIAELADLLKKK